MPRVADLIVELEVVTPLFCGGAAPNDSEAQPNWRAALRPSSFKGQLRFWYRAWQPWAVTGGEPERARSWREAAIMGGSARGEGQSPFLLSLEADDKPKPVRWRRQPAYSGRAYLAFSLSMAPNDRLYIPPRTQFRAVLRFPWQDRISDPVVRGVIGAWWLLCHVGGVGNRSRRGFGSLRLRALHGGPAAAEALIEELGPLPSTASDSAVWADRFNHGLRVLANHHAPNSRWPNRYAHPHLGLNACAAIVRGPDPTGWEDWESVLEDCGTMLKQQRAAWRGRENGPEGLGPVRVTFGLPLSMGRGASARRWIGWHEQRHGEALKGSRHSSPLHLTVAAHGSAYGAVWTRLDGALPGRGYPVREQGADRSWRRELPDAPGEFMEQLRTSGALMFRFGSGEES